MVMSRRIVSRAKWNSFVALTVAVTFGPGCGDGLAEPTPPPPPQSEISTTYTKSVNAVDDTGQPVATFDFTQVVTDRAGQLPITVVTYTVTNLLTRPLCVTYNIAFQLNLDTWSDSGRVNNLAAGQTESKGQIATPPARLDLGAAAINFTSDPRQPCGGPPPPSLGGMWSQTDFFDVPSNSSLGMPRQQGFLNFTVASNGNTTVTIIYLNQAGLATGRTHNASGTLDSAGAFSGTGSGPDGRFRMTGQLTATSPEPGSGRMQVRFTFTQHWGTSPSGDVGPFVGTARRTP